MSAYTTDTRTENDIDSRAGRRTMAETKAAFKTTEFFVFLLAVVGVLIASNIVDGFGAERAWLYITMLTIGYLVSRGLAKAGTAAPDTDSRSKR